MDKMGLALAKLSEEDPTIDVSRNLETHEILLSGVGTGHLEITVSKLQRKYNVEVILQAVQHKGFSVVQVLSPCVTFVGKDQFNIIKSQLHYLDRDPDYDPTSRSMAFGVVDETDRISVGVIFRKEKPSYLEKWSKLKEIASSRETTSLEKLMEVFRP